MSHASRTSTQPDTPRSLLIRTTTEGQSHGLGRVQWSRDETPAEPYDDHRASAMIPDTEETRIGVLAALVACSFLGFCIGCVALVAWLIGKLYGLNP